MLFYLPLNMFISTIIIIYFVEHITFKIRSKYLVKSYGSDLNIFFCDIYSTVGIVVS